MSKELIVSSTAHETKVAILEDDDLVEVFFEREQQHGLAGSIYKGRVTRVLPGMQSAFVNIGLDRDAFLYVSDFFEDNDEYDRIVTTVEDKVVKMEEKAAPSPSLAAPPPAERAAPAPSPDEPPQPDLPPRYVDAPSDRWGPAGRRGPGGVGRRGRRRGSPRPDDRRGFPDSKFASRPDAYRPDAPPAYRSDTPPASRPEAPPDPRPEPPPAPFAGSTFEVLPGESLAKYRQPRSRFDYPPEPDAAPAPAEVVASDEEEATLEALRRDLRLEHSIPDAETELESSLLEAGLPEPALTLETAAEPPLVSHTPTLEEPAPAPEPEALDTAAPAVETHPPAPEPEALPAPPEGSAEPPPEAIAGREASLREQPYGRRYLQRNHRRGRGRRDPNRDREPSRDRDRDRDRRPPEPVAVEAAPAPARLEANITDLLKPGQEIIVQIAKEPLGKKGARITSHIALPGRYLVYMPTVDHVGVSRKIQSDDERLRLKRVVQGHRTGMSGGFIVRTAGESHSDDEIRADMDFLYNLWLDLRQKAERRPAPALVHHDLHLVERILRDQLTGTFKNIWVDSQEDYEHILQFVERFQPGLVGRVKLYTRANPIFDEFGITPELEKALRPKVWLKSGGYIVINQTEALVAIDVNTGKYVGKSNRLEDTIVKTNLDAVKEIVRQIRLRDLGGIIVVDFIDMDERKNRQKVMQALDEELREDRAPSKILQFNDFGLVAITRKRVKQSLERTLCSPCPYCDAAGYVKSVETMIQEILAEAKKIARTLDGRDITLRVHPEVARVLKSRDNSFLEEIESVLRRPVLVKGDPLLHQEKFDFN